MVASPAFAGPCIRNVGISEQVSGGEGSGSLLFRVFTGGCAAPGGVDYSVVAGTATANADYAPQSGHLSWSDGDPTDKWISVVIVQDAVLDELSIEDFAVKFTVPDPTINLVQASGQGRILDDEPAPILWSVDNITCTGQTPDPNCLCPDVSEIMPYEPNCGVPPIDVSDRLISAAYVQWHTMDGTAKAGTHYLPVLAGITVIPAGMMTGQLRINLIPQPPGSRSKCWFYVRFTAVSAGVIADGTAKITIDCP